MTVEQDRLLKFLSYGINRVSMGVQSFDSELLSACGRAHSLVDVYKALDVIKNAGLDNFSIDLIRYRHILDCFFLLWFRNLRQFWSTKPNTATKKVQMKKLISAKSSRRVVAM